MPYFGVPKRRGRWRTGISVIRAPAISSSAGRNRWVPLNTGTLRSGSMRQARSVQPTSVTESPVTRLRTRLATFDEIRRTQVSLRSTRTPQTTSQSGRCSSRRGMSAGSFWRSASRVTTTGARAAFQPEARAADWPRLGVWRRMRTRGSAAASSRRVAGVRSVEPSSTKIASNGIAAPSRAWAISPQRMATLSSSLYAGTTTDTAGTWPARASVGGPVVRAAGREGGLCVGDGGSGRVTIGSTRRQCTRSTGPVLTRSG